MKPVDRNSPLDNETSNDILAIPLKNLKLSDEITPSSNTEQDLAEKKAKDENKEKPPLSSLPIDVFSIIYRFLPLKDIKGILTLNNFFSKDTRIAAAYATRLKIQDSFPYITDDVLLSITSDNQAEKPNEFNQLGSFFKQETKKWKNLEEGIKNYINLHQQFISNFNNFTGMINLIIQSETRNLVNSIDSFFSNPENIHLTQESDYIQKKQSYEKTLKKLPYVRLGKIDKIKQITDRTTQVMLLGIAGAFGYKEAIKEEIITTTNPIATYNNRKLALGFASALGHVKTTKYLTQQPDWYTFEDLFKFIKITCKYNQAESFEVLLNQLSKQQSFNSEHLESILKNTISSKQVIKLLPLIHKTETESIVLSEEAIKKCLKDSISVDNYELTNMIFKLWSSKISDESMLFDLMKYATHLNKINAVHAFLDNIKNLDENKKHTLIVVTLIEEKPEILQLYLTRFKPIERKIKQFISKHSEIDLCAPTLNILRKFINTPIVLGPQLPPNLKKMRANQLITNSYNTSRNVTPTENSQSTSGARNNNETNRAPR